MLVLIAGGLLWQIQRLISANASVDRADRVIAQANLVQKRLLDMETGVRGYALTKNFDFLAPYTTSNARVDQDIQDFKALSLDHEPSQVRMRIVSESLTRWRAYAETLLRSIDQPDASRRILSAGVGKKHMDAMRAEISAITNEKEAIRRQRTEMARSTSHWVTFFAGASLLATGLLFWFVSRRQLMRVSKAYGQALDVLRTAASDEAIRRSERRTQALVNSVRDYAIVIMDDQGMIVGWNTGAELIKGYKKSEVLGRHFSLSYTPEDIAANVAGKELEIARRDGRYEAEGWRVRKDGSRFWANVVTTAIFDDEKRLVGYAHITRDLTERKRLEDNQARLGAELQSHAAALAAANRELEAFSYSVSHDLRSPLRGIDGFSQALLEDYSDKLDERGRRYLERVRAGTQRMGQLIDDLLNLSRLSRAEMTIEQVDLSSLAHATINELAQLEPGRIVNVQIQDGLVVQGDSGLLTAALTNLLNNAWKFTANNPNARIEFGMSLVNGTPTYFVRDNGAGFNMAYVDKLFGTFQRLHKTNEFAGTGVGLATVKRIVHRHGGRIWAEGEVGKGATFYFTLGETASFITKGAA